MERKVIWDISCCTDGEYCCAISGWECVCDEAAGCEESHQFSEGAGGDKLAEASVS